MITTKNNDAISQSIRYPGGKGLLYQRLISLIPPHYTYIEAFAGGGAVARNKLPARVNIAIDADAAALERLRLAITRSALAGNGDTAGNSGAIAGNGEAGSRIVTGPGAVTARAGSVGNGDTAAAPIVTAGEVTRLAAWQFLNTDALAWLAAYDWRGDEFVYADPPYLLETRRQSHRRLYRCELERDDHERLLSLLVTLPCPVMVSGYYSNLYAEALAGWHTATFETTTRGGSPATEWIWMNYPEPVALHDYRYLGDGFRERERIKRKKKRWVERLRRMDTLEKQAILAAIEEAEL